MEQGLTKTENQSLQVSQGNVSLAFHANWNKWLQIATTVYKSGVLNKTWANPESVMFGFMKCHELGLSPINGIQDMFLINGKVSMEVHLQNALIHRSGERVEFKIEEGDGLCKCYMKRKDGMEYASIFTTEDARRAGLIGGPNKKDNWEKYPKDMLRSRANAIGNRILFSHVLKGLHYSPEELGYATTIHGETGEPGISDSPAEYVEVFDEQSTYDRLSKQIREMNDKKWTADVCLNWRDANLSDIMKISDAKRNMLIRQFNIYVKQFGDSYGINGTQRSIDEVKSDTSGKTTSAESTNAGSVGGESTEQRTGTEGTAGTATNPEVKT